MWHGAHQPVRTAQRELDRLGGWGGRSGRSLRERACWRQRRGGSLWPCQDCGFHWPYQGASARMTGSHLLVLGQWTGREGREEVRTPRQRDHVTRDGAQVDRGRGWDRLTWEGELTDTDGLGEEGEGEKQKGWLPGFDLGDWRRRCDSLWGGAWDMPSARPCSLGYPGGPSKHVMGNRTSGAGVRTLGSPGMRRAGGQEAG